MDAMHRLKGREEWEAELPAIERRVALEAPRPESLEDVPPFEIYAGGYMLDDSKGIKEAILAARMLGEQSQLTLQRIAEMRGGRVGIVTIEPLVCATTYVGACFNGAWLTLMWVGPQLDMRWIAHAERLPGEQKEAA